MLSQFASPCTNSRCSNRIYTIILIRHNETQVPNHLSFIVYGLLKLVIVLRLEHLLFVHGDAN